MYGEGFLPEGKDACTSGEGISPSYVYEIDTASLEIERVVEVGAVPKYVAATPDGKHVLVSNWCSMDLSVIDAKTAKVVKTIPLGGENPRGIAVSPDSSTAYVANMGNDETVKVDLGSGEVTPFASTGVNPRHLLMSPKGDRLYITNAGSGTVSKVDTGNGEVVGEATVGADPRSMAMSPDGAALYVANYDSATVSKVRAEDMSVLQTVETDDVPIGITYEPTKKRVWVASYNGSLVVYDDSRRAA
nr:YncE family protein [Janibacter alkaliphilus]